MAIAFDAVSSGSLTVSSTRTWSHTCSGANRILFVTTYNNDTASSITGVTYNGVGMTLLAQSTHNNIRNVTWYLIAPDSGANNVIVTASNGSGSIGGSSASYTGALQSGVPDASQVGSSDGDYTGTVTTVAANCWTVLTVINVAVDLSAGTGTTERINNLRYGFIGDSNGALSSGSHSMTVTSGDGGAISCVMFSFAPAVSANTGNLLMAM